MASHTTQLHTRALPCFEDLLSFELSAPVTALRDRALARQRQEPGLIVPFEIIDARTWDRWRREREEKGGQAPAPRSRAGAPLANWLIWRARRCAERLRGMPIDVEPGERIVGKPEFRVPTEEEKAQLEEARRTLASMPPFPGGDAGHFHPDYEKLFRVGIGGILDEIESRSKTPGLADEQRTFYEACRIAMEGLSDFARRVGDACEATAASGDGRRRRELAAVCRRVANDPPATFHEAVQLMFLALIALWFGEDHGLTNPGRMDQTLRPFYEADLAAGRVTPEEALELIACLYIHLNRILWPGSAVAVMVGGRDGEGRDATNDLTYLCLAARLATRLVYPTVGLAWHDGTPEELMDFSTRMLATGIGDPAFFNDELIAEGLREHGVSKEDSYNYMNSTCVEIKVCGASHRWVTAPYYSCPRALLEAMEDVATGKRARPRTFKAFVGRVRERIAGAVSRTAEELDRIWEERGRTGGFPLASCLINDCLARGRDFDQGGPRYNWVENSFVGLANLTDGLAAVKRLVYEERELTIEEFHAILEGNFGKHEELRRRIVNTFPRYGNDDDEPDRLAADLAQFLIATTESNIIGGHRYVPGFFCWVMHGVLGAELGATPDGRRAGEPLADGAGAAQGRERRGPTASILSTTKWSHRKALGGVVHNAKFSKSLLRTDGDRRALRDVIETYLRRGGFEIQINVVGKETLLEAQKRPERHRDLLVRVAGYSDYFVHLDERMQNEVISRTEFATT